MRSTRHCLTSKKLLLHHHQRLRTKSIRQSEAFLHHHRRLRTEFIHQSEVFLYHHYQLPKIQPPQRLTLLRIRCQHPQLLHFHYLLLQQITFTPALSKNLNHTDHIARRAQAPLKRLEATRDPYFFPLNRQTRTRGIWPIGIR